MERESFEDRDVAEILNKHFISIKVDREERPDIDHIYMMVCQMMTGHGGWPLTIIMTPDKKPFFAGTYFPKHDRYGMPGILSVLTGVHEAWTQNKNELQNAGEQITEAIQARSTNVSGSLSDKVIHDAYKQFVNIFDEEYGGFGSAPKFPSPHNLFFLLRYWRAYGERKALDMVTKTLDSMYSGGIYDHIGFGFCRYSTDRKWLVPHFEKMLYDNALLSMAYLETYQATGNKEYADISKEIFEYIRRNMTSPEGAFYSAEDADSEGVEGLFYLWSKDEVISILGKEDGEYFCKIFGITVKGNFEGRNIPNLIKSAGIDREFVKKCREKLFAVREKRIHPFKDDKILTSWNALMAASYAMGGRILSDDSLTDMAGKAVEFIETALTGKNKRLLARYRDNEAAIPAYLDDYAYLAWAYLELYDTTFEPEFLKKAIKINDDMKRLFIDKENGGFFFYGNDAEKLIARPKDAYDGAMPSGNSVAAMNILRLSRITGKTDLVDEYENVMRCFARQILQAPLGYTHMLTSHLLYLHPSQEVILVAGNDRSSVKPFIDVLRSGFRPFTASVLYGSGFYELKELIPYIAEYPEAPEKALAYVCRNFACGKPVTNSEDLKQSLLQPG
ncbi:MAG: thioredoxin domain-containing protein [Clostridiaceae bacterium]|jgi:uncharacterized protein YyaL (SSP411 family)|nr:thioredoxin domain-containing protein [Clostridiaceae bacterium]